MSEQVAIVTGAGGELGRATAEKLTAAGFTVAGIDRNEQGLKELPDGIRSETAASADPAAARTPISGAGSIVHVASRPGLEPAAGQASYALSKAALVHLIRILDLELRPSGIRVNGVAPQLLNTAATRSFASPDVLAHAVTPEAVAGLLTYLASDAAAPVSGAVVPAYGA